MPDDDSMLGQNLVDVRNEERRHRTTMPLAFCTQDNQCAAEADQHQPDCPVEQRLRDELGF